MITNSHYWFLIIDFPLSILNTDLLGIKKEYQSNLDVYI
jgi:hypothetical protein